jgi:hypothetical protein
MLGDDFFHFLKNAICENWEASFPIFFYVYYSFEIDRNIWSVVIPAMTLMREPANRTKIEIWLLI